MFEMPFAAAAPALDTPGGGLFAPDRVADAIAFYDEAREREPVLRIGAEDWLLTRWEDARAVLRDTRFSSAEQKWVDGPPDRAIPAAARQWMLFQDPPDHTRLRRLVQQAFQARCIRAMEPDIEAMVDGLLDRVAGDGRMDVIADLARPLPVNVICAMLDVPEADREAIRLLARDSSLLLDGEFLDGPRQSRAMAASAALREYFDDLVDDRRARPGDDLLSGLIAAEADGDGLARDEIVAMADMLFLAGHETTVNLIGNGTRAMLDRGLLPRLAADPALLPTAVEECLRFTPSVSMTGRTASEDLEVGGIAIPRGHGITIPMDAVNRDPARFPDPHRFDVARADNAHLTFAIGPHVCLGAALARLEAQVAWRRLLDRFREVRAVAPSRWREHVVLRGLESVEIAFELRP